MTTTIYTRKAGLPKTGKSLILTKKLQPPPRKVFLRNIAIKNAGKTYG